MTILPGIMINAVSAPAPALGGLCGNRRPSSLMGRSLTAGEPARATGTLAPWCAIPFALRRQPYSEGFKSNSLYSPMMSFVNFFHRKKNSFFIILIERRRSTPSVLFPSRSDYGRHVSAAPPASGCAVSKIPGCIACHRPQGNRFFRSGGGAVFVNFFSSYTARRFARRQSSRRIVLFSSGRSRHFVMTGAPIYRKKRQLSSRPIRAVRAGQLP